MPIYEGTETDQITKEAMMGLEKHREDVEKATQILLSQELPPFLALKAAAKLIGQEEAEILQKRLNRA